MKSLLTKVQALETQTQQTLNDTTQAGTKQVRTLLAAEEQVLEDVRQKARKRAQAIVSEAVNATKQELNALHQDEARSVAAIHNTAAQRRSATMALVLDLFRQEYQA